MESRELVRRSVKQSVRNHLLLNVSNIKEMVKRGQKNVTRPIRIIGEEVDSYRYLRYSYRYLRYTSFYFLRKLRSFNAATSWRSFSSLSQMPFTFLINSQCWNHHWPESFQSVMDKLLPIMYSPSHMIHSTLLTQQRAVFLRLTELLCHKECFRKLFLPLSINRFNKSVLCVMGEDTYQL